jgi:hypothetical protein
MADYGAWRIRGGAAGVEVVMPQSPASRLTKGQKLLIAAAAASALLWFVPYGQVALYPLALLNTHIHELGHALSAIATGGSVERIEVYASTGGVAPIRGGFLPLIASAGYVGASLYGAGLILFSRTPKGARRALGFTGILLAASLLIFVRADAVGWLAGALWSIICILLARRLKGEGAQFSAQFLGMQQCAASAAAFGPLLGASLESAHSDAEIMEQALLLPGPVWAVLWFVMSMALMVWSLRRAWGGAKLAAR